MINSKLIVMLTNNDKTVKDAIEVFDSSKDLPVQFWGFKNIGLPIEQMKQLVENMKNAEKTTFLEVVTYTEDECMKAAKLAVECNFDYLMGTLFYDSVFNFLKDKPIKYSPFCGKVSGSPSILEGTINEIISDAKNMQRKGIDAFDILAYRYIGDPEEIAKKFIQAIDIPVIIAGSINSYERLDKINELNPWGFTMGTALFKKNFDKDGTFKDNLKKVIDYLNK
jgi:hypothetical protein